MKNPNLKKKSESGKLSGGGGRTTSINLDGKDLSRLEEIKQWSGVTNQNLIIKRALALYHFILKEEHYDRVFLTTDADGSNPTRLALF